MQWKTAKNLEKLPQKYCQQIQNVQQQKKPKPWKTAKNHEKQS